MEPTCCVVRVKMRQEVVLAAPVLKIETVDHEVGAIDPFEVL